MYLDGFLNKYDLNTLNSVAKIYTPYIKTYRSDRDISGKIHVSQDRVVL